jgi:transposase
MWTCSTLLLHHDNAPAQTYLKATEYVIKKNMVIVPYPPYSPDLAPCVFALFPKLKMKLKGWCFETVSDIQREPQAVLDSIKENDLRVAFEAWKKWWDSCIRTQGDYLEEYDSQNWVSLTKIYFLT